MLQIFTYVILYIKISQHLFSFRGWAGTAYGANAPPPPRPPLLRPSVLLPLLRLQQFLLSFLLAYERQLPSGVLIVPPIVPPRHSLSMRVDHYYLPFHFLYQDFAPLVVRPKYLCDCHQDVLLCKQSLLVNPSMLLYRRLTRRLDRLHYPMPQSKLLFPPALKMLFRMVEPLLLVLMPKHRQPPSFLFLWHTDVKCPLPDYRRFLPTLNAEMLKDWLARFVGAQSATLQRVLKNLPLMWTLVRDFLTLLPPIWDVARFGQSLTHPPLTFDMFPWPFWKMQPSAFLRRAKRAQILFPFVNPLLNSGTQARLQLKSRALQQ